MKILELAVFVLVLLCTNGCASSSNLQDSSQTSGTNSDPRSNFIERFIDNWGVSKLELMKSIQNYNLEHHSYDDSGDIIYYDQGGVRITFRFYHGRYGAVEFSYATGVGTTRYYEELYSQMIKYADDIDSRNRLLFNTKSGAIAVEKDVYSIKVINTSIAAMK
jgi:hypothetical protein